MINLTCKFLIDTIAVPYFSEVHINFARMAGLSVRGGLSLFKLPSASSVSPLSVVLSQSYSSEVSKLN